MNEMKSLFVGFKSCQDRVCFIYSVTKGATLEFAPWFELPHSNRVFGKSKPFVFHDLKSSGIKCCCCVCVCVGQIHSLANAGCGTYS